MPVKEDSSFYCYIVQCADDSFYTGWTTDPQRRAKQHNNGTGAKYTRTHRPVTLVYYEEVPGLSAAMKRERVIKHMTHSRKKALIQSQLTNNKLEK